MNYAWTILIAIHAVAASYALIFGAINLWREPKGDRPHRIIGFTWLASMYFVIISSFWIQSLKPGHYSWIHGLSIFTFFTISLGLYAAMHHNVKAHRGYMRGSYFGLLGALVGVVAFPTRLIPQMAIHDTARFVAVALCIAASAAFFAIATVSFFKDDQPKLNRRRS